MCLAADQQKWRQRLANWTHLLSDSQNSVSLAAYGNIYLALTIYCAATLWNEWSDTSWDSLSKEDINNSQTGTCTDSAIGVTVCEQNRHPVCRLAMCYFETWRHVLKLLGTKIQTYWLVIYYFTFLHSFTKHFLMCSCWLHHHDIYVVMFRAL